MLKHIKRLLLKFFFLCIVAGAAAAYWVWHEYSQFLEAPLDIPPEGVVFQIPRGASIAAVAHALESQHLISEAHWLRLHARLDYKGKMIKAGEYKLLPGMTPELLFSLFVSGKTISYSITLIEGWSFKQIMAEIEAHPALIKSLSGNSLETIMQKLGYPGEHPEGRFFPDTYNFPRNTSDLDLLQRAYNRMSRVLEDAWARREENIPLKSSYEALILASIVEKETGAASERAEIAGVFSRRLRKGMKLQTDPTVIYGMGARYKGNIRRKDLKEDTPYNTYLHTGLPPTPICMPGADAIAAAMNPKIGKSLYFVAKGDGTHQFSSTLKQHNKAVRKYQLKR
jgi:UPF0755 protein